MTRGMKRVFSWLLAAVLVPYLVNFAPVQAKAEESGETVTYEDLQEEGTTLFSSSDLQLLSAATDQISYQNPDTNHGLRPNITFTKFEIDYNKYSTNNVEYIVIHDTGNPKAGADAMAHYQYFAGGDRNASAHYFVDDKQVVQIIDDSEGSWHCGIKYKTYATPISNYNSIGIEMCINADGNYDEAMRNTIDLAAYLLWKYDLPMERLARHFDANGKRCPLTMSDNNWARWNEFKAAVAAKLATYQSHNSGSDTESASDAWYYNKIMGTSDLSATVLKNVLLSNNTALSEQEAQEVAESYINIGKIYGIRGDIAFFQCMLETGYLRYGGEVDRSWHNYCGLKNADATGYAKYDTIAKGVEAHIQHLYCYASTDPIPASREKLDPRFFDWLRGQVTCWEDLSGRWAVPGYDPSTFSSVEQARSAHKSYGDIIVSLYRSYGGQGVYTTGSPGSSGGTYWDDPIYKGGAAATRTVLVRTMTGSDVKEAQGYLKAIGFTYVDVNGVFDENTYKAVVAFQKLMDLEADGCVGEYTWTKLINTYVAVVLGEQSVIDINDPNQTQSGTNQTPSENQEAAQTPSEGQQTTTVQKTVTISEKTGISVSGRSMVYKGKSGNDVKALQTLLNELGYGLDTDGIFGNGTDRAVRDFQTKNGLDVDGYVGNATWAKLGSMTVTVTETVTVPDTGSSSAAQTTPETPEQTPETTPTENTETTTQTPAENNQPATYTTTVSQVLNISVEGRGTVKMGRRNSDVTALQRLLNYLGYQLVVDGDFGPATNMAVIDFQRKHHLDVDGVVGPATWAAIGAVEVTVEGSAPSSGSQQTQQPAQTESQPQNSQQTQTSGNRPSTSSRKTLRMGSSGEDVKAMQILLNEKGASLDTDGIFGRATQNALVAYQRSQGLEADGICGPLTWAKLGQ